MGETYMDIDEARKVYKLTGYDPFFYFEKENEDEIIYICENHLGLHVPKKTNKELLELKIQFPNIKFN